MLCLQAFYFPFSFLTFFPFISFPLSLPLYNALFFVGEEGGKRQKRREKGNERGWRVNCPLFTRLKLLLHSPFPSLCYPLSPSPLCFPSRVRTGAAGFGTDRACLVLVTWRFLRMRLCECVARIASLRRPTTSPFTPFFAMPFFGVLCVYPSRLFLFVLWPAQDFSNC